VYSRFSGCGLYGGFLGRREGFHHVLFNGLGELVGWLKGFERIFWKLKVWGVFFVRGWCSGVLYCGRCTGIVQ